MPSNVPWKSLIEILSSMYRREFVEDFQPSHYIAGDKSFEVSSGSGVLEFSDKSNISENTLQVTFFQKFYDALLYSFCSNWKIVDKSSKKLDDCLSPGCFLYLIERFLILVSQCQGFFFSVRSSFLEWLTSEQFEARATSCHSISIQSSEKFYEFIAAVVQFFIYDKAGACEWISRSKIKVDLYYKQMILRLVFILCLLCVNCGKYYYVLFDVLSVVDVADQLPKELYGILQQGMNNKHLEICEIGQAFQKGGDPLLFVNLGESVAGVEYPSVIYVQLGSNCSRDEILGLLLPDRTDSPLVQISSHGFSAGH